MKKIISIIYFLLFSVLVFSQGTLGTIVTNRSSGGAITGGCGSCTVDNTSLFKVRQTTSGQTITVPNAASSTIGRFIEIYNDSISGSVPFTLVPGGVIPLNKGVKLQWVGTKWLVQNVVEVVYDSLQNYVKKTGDSLTGDYIINNGTESHIKQLTVGPEENFNFNGLSYIDINLSTYDNSILNVDSAGISARVGNFVGGEGKSIDFTMDQVTISGFGNEEIVRINDTLVIFDRGLNVNTSGHNYYAKHRTDSLTYHRKFQYPDSSGTFAIRSDLNSYLPLSGGEMTGSITANGGTLVLDPVNYYLYNQNGEISIDFNNHVLRDRSNQNRVSFSDESLEYLSDVSGTYTIRSLTDKGYVDGKVNAAVSGTSGQVAYFNGTNSITSGSGLTYSGSNLGLSTGNILLSGGTRSIGTNDGSQFNFITNGTTRMLCNASAAAWTIGSSPIATLPVLGLNIGSRNNSSWTTTGTGLVIAPTTFNDATSSGTVAATAINVFNAPTIAASSATIFTVASSNDFYMPIAGTNVTIGTGCAQRWLYDASNYASISVSSNGTTSFDAIGTNQVFVFSRELRANANFSTSNSSVQASLFVHGFVTQTTQSEIQIGGVQTYARIWERGSTTTLPASGANYASHIIGNQAVTIASSGTHPIFANLAIKPISITAGTGTASISATVYIEGAATGAGQNYAFWNNGNSRFSGNLNIDDGINVNTGTTTGMKILTSTSQKLGFWNATPISQPNTGVGSATFTANTSANFLYQESTFDGYTISQVVKALRNMGILQ